MIPASSNLSRSSRSNQGTDHLRRIEKIGLALSKKYEVGPLACPNCQVRMRIGAFIENDRGIKKIPERLGSCEVKARPEQNQDSPMKAVDLGNSLPLCILVRPESTSGYQRHNI
jgi:hypothetical protein